MNVLGGQPVGPSGRVLPLSTAIETEGFIFVSGQLALRNGRVEGDISEQTHAAFDSIEGILDGAGLSLDNIVKATIWIADPSDFAEFNAVYGERLSAPYPARSCVVSKLVVPEALVEIEVIAARRDSRLGAR